MFTDLVGSAELKRRLGDTIAADAIEKHDRLFRDCLSRHDGIEEQDTGDGFLVRFDRPTDAIRCALDFQEGLAELNTPERLHARVGIHMGEITRIAGEKEGDGREKIVGLAVDTTARLMGLALPNQILMTVGTFDSARQQMLKGPDDAEVVWMAHGPYLFKGLDETTEVFEVGVPDVAPLRAPEDSEKAKSATRIGDELTLGWRPAIGIEIPQRTNWVLERSLGEGGFGEIWLARHKQSKARRVFKFCFEAEKLRGLKREVTVFRLIKETLGHRDDITELLDWSFDDAPFFIESEYTEGGDLGEWVSAQGGFSEIPLETRLELIAQTATALHAAHSVGVIHKDIKAGNILVSQDVDGNPRAVLTDFGIGAITDRRLLMAKGITAAGLTEVAADRADFTTSGTRLYMAPEILEGKPVTTAADIYALGVLLFQVVCGQLTRVLAPGWERDIEDEFLREDIAACVEGDPERRLSSAAELATRLRSLDRRREAREEERRRQEEAERAKVLEAQHRRRQRLFVVASAVGVLLTAVVALVALRESHRARTEARLRQKADLAQAETAKALYFANIGLIDRYIKELRLEWARDQLALCPPEFRHWEWGRLELLRNPDLMTFSEHTAQVWSVAFSPDDNWFATAGEDSKAYIWDVESGNKLATLEGHSAGVLAIVFSPDGSRLATAGRDGTVRIWDAATGDELVRIGADWTLGTLDYSPDGKRLAIPGPSGTVEIYDAETGSKIKSLGAHRFSVNSIEFSADGASLLTSSRDGTARIWNVETGEERQVFKTGQGLLNWAGFSPDNSVVATSADNGWVEIWNAATGEKLQAIAPTAGRAFGGAFSPDGKTLAVGLDKKLIKLWDVESGAERLTLKGHEHGVRAVEFTSDGRILGSGSWDTTAKFWDISPTRATARKTTFTASSNWAIASGQEVILVASRSNDKVSFRDLVTGREQLVLTDLPENLNDFAISSDGRHLATTLGQKAVLRDAKTGKPVRTFEGHENVVTRVEFSPSGKLLASGSSDGQVIVWDPATGESLQSIRAYDKNLWGLALSADDTLLATMKQGEAAKVWSVETGKLVQEYAGDFKGEASQGIWSVAFHPTERKLAYGQFEGNVKIVDPISGEEFATCKGHTGPIYSVTFSPDGRRLVTGSWDTTAKIWDVETGRELLTLEGNSGWVTAVCFSRNGKHLASVSTDNVATYWPAFSWDESEYPGNPKTQPFETRLELYKRKFWKTRASYLRASE